MLRGPRRALLASSRPTMIADYDELMTLIAPLVWIRMRETSGNTAVNSGSLGTDANATISGTTTLGQTGQIGANDAFLYDGLNSRTRVPAVAGWTGLTAFTLGFLVNPATAGESSQGYLGALQQAGGTDILHVAFNTSLNAMRCRVTNDAAGVFTTTASVGIPAATWSWVFVTYDDGGDRTPRIYKSSAGALVEIAADGASGVSGTLAARGTFDIGNNNATTRTFSGLIDEAFMVSGILTTGRMQNVIFATGVTGG
jgi:hypothetical protein